MITTRLVTTNCALIGIYKQQTPEMSLNTEQRWDAFREYRKKSERQLLKISLKTETDVKDAKNDLESQDQLCAAETRRSLPLELLAGEWLNEQCSEVASKTYVMDKLLPTLILGMEKLLTEVSDRGLEEAEGTQYDFNPLNLLAQYLMRNNPLHSSLPENNPYCSRLRQVSEQLKQASLAVPVEVLMEAKAASRERVERREQEEMRQLQEKQQRIELLQNAFMRWKTSEETVNKLELCEALSGWTKYKQLPTDLLQSAEEIMDEQTFSRVVMEGMASVGREMFDSVVEYLCECGEERRRRRGWEEWRDMLKEAFEHCDASKIGSLSREEVYDTLMSYYNTSADDIKQTMLNPSLWPLSVLMSTAAVPSHSTETTGEPQHEEKREGEGDEVNDGEEKKKEGEEGEGEGERKKKEGGEGEGEGKKKEGEEGGGKGEGEGKKKEGEGEGEGKKKDEDGGGEGGEGEGERGEDTEVVAEVMVTVKVEDTEVKEEGGKGERGREKTEECLQETRTSIEVKEFVGTVELFVGAQADRSIVESLAAYMRDKYTDSAKERAQRQQEVQKRQSAELWRGELEAVFAAWDVDRSGSVDVSELHLVAAHWDPGAGAEGEKAREHIKEVLSHQGHEVTRLPRLLFCAHLHQLTLPLSPEHRHTFTQHLITSIQYSEEAVSRGRRREEMLSGLRLAAEKGGLRFSTVMQAALSAIQEDGVVFGGGKQCSVSIALLEDDRLCYRASTEPGIIGKTLSRTEKQVSFQAVDARRPVHVPSIQQHGNVAFLLPNHSTDQYQGSLVVSPLLSPTDRAVVGTISVDTLTLTSEEHTSITTFEEHEIHFCQGVCECLAELYWWMSTTAQGVKEAQTQLTKLAASTALAVKTSLYVVEPLGSSKEGWQLRPVLSDGGVDSTAGAIPPTSLEQLSRHHIFRSIMSGTPVSSYSCGQHYLAWPVSGCGSSGSKSHPLAVIELATPPLTGMEPEQLQLLSTTLQHITF